MWWPGTELNRRRQPFQGCALPPELPGHFLSAQLCPQNDWRPIWPCTVRALTGRDAAKQNSRCAWDRAELSNYNKPPQFLQNGCGDCAARFLAHVLSYVLADRFLTTEDGR